LPDKIDVDKRLLEIVKESSPKDVKELLQLAEKNLGIPQKEILEHILILNDKEKLNLTKNNAVKTSGPSWLWIVVILALGAVASVIFIPENLFPYIYIRNVLGFILVIFLPGYSMTRALFPKGEIDNIERAALSIGLSLSIVTIIGIILNYTPMGIRPIPITIGLMGLTLILSLFGAFKQ
jgi:hypothetical protein